MRHDAFRGRGSTQENHMKHLTLVLMLAIAGAFLAPVSPVYGSCGSCPAGKEKGKDKDKDKDGNEKDKDKDKDADK